MNYELLILYFEDLITEEPNGSWCINGDVIIEGHIKYSSYHVYVEIRLLL